MLRKKSFEQACREYVHRYTVDHVPAWALVEPDSGVERGDPVRPGYYAPHFASDREWYDHTRFHGEEGHIGNRRYCFTTGATWPLGKWLQKPYRGRGYYVSGDDKELSGAAAQQIIIDRAKEDCAV